MYPVWLPVTEIQNLKKNQMYDKIYYVIYKWHYNN